MKRIVVLSAALFLVGCGRWVDVDSDAFAQGPVSQEQFTVDSSDCRLSAETDRSFTVRGIAAAKPEKHYIYSDAYVACMKAKGYRKRTHWYNFWQAYRL